jgi:hypothetical protein
MTSSPSSSPFVEFTRNGPASHGRIALHVSQIKAVEQSSGDAESGYARVVLFEKTEGYDWHWTKEPYAVVAQRLLAARNEQP